MSQQELAPIDRFTQSLATRQKQFASVLPAHIKPEKFMRTIVGAVQNNPEILKCSFETVVQACQKAATDGLLLDNREAALVPFNCKEKDASGREVWVKKASYQPMIDGVLKKVRNSGNLGTIMAVTVNEKDAFKYNPAMDEVPNHNPDWFGDRGNMVGVYAFARLKDGSPYVEIMNLEEIEKVRKVSKSGNDDHDKPKGTWKEWYEQKAKVAVLKRLCRRLPSSSDVEQLFEHDNEDYNLNRGQMIQQMESMSASQKMAQLRPKQTIDQAPEVVTGEPKAEEQPALPFDESTGEIPPHIIESFNERQAEMASLIPSAEEIERSQREAARAYKNARGK